MIIGLSNSSGLSRHLAMLCTQVPSQLRLEEVLGNARHDRQIPPFNDHPPIKHSYLIKPIVPLHGLPISIEENIDTKNMDRTAGFVVGRVDKLRMMCMFRSYCGMLAMCSTHER